MRMYFPWAFIEIELISSAKKQKEIIVSHRNVTMMYSNSFRKNMAHLEMLCRIQKKNSRGRYFTILITSYLRQAILCNIILFYGKTLKTLLQSTYIVFCITATLNLISAHAFDDARPFSLKSRVSLGSHTWYIVHVSIGATGI